MAPHLQLSYNGGGGNSVIGLGWSFAPGSIQRRTDKGIPRYIDGPNGIDDDFDGVEDNPEEIDVFIEPSGEDLVPVLDAAHPSITNYFCKIESNFNRYRRIDDYWECQSPTGRRMVFGQSPSARIVDPANTNHVFEWLLERESDTHGNTVEYRYASFEGEAHLNQKYLVEVRYGPGPGPWDNYHFVVFHYEDRADWFEDCRSGFVLRTGKRLTSVDMGTQGPILSGHAQGDFNGDGLTDNLNTRYVLGYDTNQYRSSLVSVTLIGADGQTSYPSSTFAYTAIRADPVLSASDQTIGSVNEPPATFESDFVDLVDLNGDGLPDLLKTEPGGAGHFGYINQGQQGSLAPSILWGPERVVNAGTDGLAWNANFGNSNTHVADVDGDGLADLVQVEPSTVYFYRNDPGFGGAALSWNDRAALVVQDFPPPAPFGSPRVHSADINFDKRMDIIRSIPVGDGVAYQIWYNLPQNTFSQRQTVTPNLGYRFDRPGIELVDFNGDRVPDLTRITFDAVRVIAGLGYGQFTDETVIPLPDGDGLSVEQLSHAKLQDIDGDGLADLVVEEASPGVLWFWLNRGNYSFDSKRIVTDLPLPVGKIRVKWADMNGNGTTDLVIADDEAIPRLTVIDIGALLGAVPRANLLKEMRNGLGAVTRLEYRSSTDYLLADGTDTNGVYQYSWRYPMPFPVDVVSSEVVSDSLGNTMETRFGYHDGFYDPVEKQFRGFARAEQIHVGDSTSPDLITRQSYDVGAVELAMKGNLLGGSTEQADGRVFTQSTNRWETRVFGVGLNGVISRWTAMTNTETFILELRQGAPKYLEKDFDYDFYGNPTVEVNWGLVENGDRLAGGDEIITRTGYAYNLDNWFLRLPQRTEASDASGSLLNRIDHFYDDESFSGNNPGSVSIGNETLVRVWYDLSRTDGYVRSRRLRYDTFGNPVLQLDPLGEPGAVSSGHSTEFEFDSRFHQYPVREIQHVGGGHADLVVQARFDEGFGVTLGVTDANGFEATSGYDAFGRLIWEVEPGDTIAFPTHEFRYVEAMPTGNGGLVNYTEARLLDQPAGSLHEAPRDAYYHIGRTYSDGLGRKRLVKGEAEPDPATGRPRYTATGGVLFNAKGAPALTLQAYFSFTPDFEDITSPAWTGLFHQEGTLIALALTNAPVVRPFYDAMGRDIRVLLPDGAATTTVYQPLTKIRADENGSDPGSPYAGKHLVDRMDGLGRTVQMDEVNKLTNDGETAPEFAIWSTLYRFRPDGPLLGITDSQGNSKTMEYDAMGRLISLHDWDKGNLEIKYDDASNRIERRDAKGQRTKYTYDGANRILTEDYLDDDSPGFHYGLHPEIRYDYDAFPALVDFGDGTGSQPTNTLGRLVHVRDTQGDEYRAYDQRGHSSWQVRSLPDPLHGEPVSFRTTYEYDALDRLSRLGYPDNDFITFEYNERTTLRRIRGGPSGFIVADRTYTPSGQEESTTFGNGVTSRYAYDSRLRMTSNKTGGVGSGADGLVSYRYKFDPASNVQEIEDLRSPGVIPDGDPRRNTQRFQYDSLYRLTGYQVSYSAPGSAARDDGHIGYRYDRIGNLLTQQSSLQRSERGWSVADLGRLSYGGSLGSSNRVGRTTLEPGPHALTRMDRDGLTRNLRYDANGNTIEMGDSAHLTWDFADHLVGYTDEVTRSEYRYDSGGRRVSKKVFSLDHPNEEPQTTLYVSRNFEIRPNNEVVKYVFDGNRRVAQISGRVNAGERMQRIRLFQGWNLAALTLDVPAVGQALQSQGVDAVRVWNPVTKSVDEPAILEGLSGGTVLWVHALSAGNVVLKGREPESRAVELSAGGTFLGWAGPQPLDVQASLPLDAPIWKYGLPENLWHIRDGLTAAADSPGLLAPGGAVYFSSLDPVTIATNRYSARIRYYHEDHLGSQAVVTDESGALTEESNYLPFGQLRHHFRATADVVDYGFGGKELDGESGLHQFEARYLLANLGRFITVDPLDHTGDPQSFNGYAYVGNRPTSFGDPTGLARSSRTTPETGFQTVGIIKKFAKNGEAEEHYTSGFKLGKSDHTFQWSQHTIVKYNKLQRYMHEVVVDKKGKLVYRWNRRNVTTSVKFSHRGGSGAHMIFVQTAEGKMYIAHCKPGEIHHTSFNGGKPVRMAGQITVKKGIIQTVDNASGHYQPGAHLLDQFKGWLASRNVNLDSARFSTWDRTDHAHLVATTSEPIEINYEPGETAVEGLQSSGESPMEGGQTGFYEDEPEPSPVVSNVPFLYI
jgi:RHS repeat-associated protein